MQSRHRNVVWSADFAEECDFAARQFRPLNPGLGREEHRFGEDQIEYHYTKNRAALRRSVRELEGEPPAEKYDEH